MTHLELMKIAKYGIEMLDTIKAIEKAYDDWAKDTDIYHGYEIDHGRESANRFNQLLETLPAEIWCN